MKSGVDIAAAFAACNGDSRSFVNDEIAANVAIPFGVSGTTAIWSDRMRNCLVTEAEHLADRTVYQICAAKTLIAQGKLSWSIVTHYYGSFFAVHALIRLQGNCYVRVGKDLVYLTADDALDPSNHNFTVRAKNQAATHKVIWNQYNSLYRKFACAPDLSPVTQSNYALWERDRRDATNYDLKTGYHEFRMKSSELNREIRRFRADTLVQAQRSLADDELGMEARALLRLKLLLTVLRQVEISSPFRTYYQSRRQRREQFVRDNLQSPQSQQRLLSWLT